MNSKARRGGLRLALLAFAALALTHCGDKENNRSLTRQAAAIKAIESAQNTWANSETGKAASYYYRIDGSPYVQTDKESQVIVGVRNDVVQCRKLMIGSTNQWVEKGNDINGRPGFPTATTNQAALATCLRYAKEEYTQNFEFEYGLKSDGQLEHFGCYYRGKEKTDFPIMVVAPRSIVRYDTGVCQF